MVRLDLVLVNHMLRKLGLKIRSAGLFIWRFHTMLNCERQQFYHKLEIFFTILNNLKIF